MRSARRLAVAGEGAILAAGLLATLAPLGHASASHARASRAPSRVAVYATRMALARLMAARSARERALRPAEPVTGVITGFVNGIGLRPFAGACVTATGPAAATPGGSGKSSPRASTAAERSRTAASRRDGRYLLADLRPGRYTLRIGGCPGDGMPASRAPMSVFWPDPPTAVTVLAGQVRTLPSATAWIGQYGLKSDRPGPSRASAARTGTGSISGRVTGDGRPLAHICAVALRPPLGFQKGPAPHATTSKTGEYRIPGLRPGRYLVLFRTGIRSCPDDANWLPQWYPYLNSAYPPDQAANVPVRAGKDTGHIDGRLKLGGEISGIVRTKTGKPVRGICVTFYTFFVVNGIYEVNVAAVSGEAGHYALHSLFPGSYQVLFSIGCGGRGDYAPQWWRDQTSPFRANSIKVRGREIVRGIDAALGPGAAVTGVVRARTAAAQPLAGVCVTAGNNQGNDLSSATTAKNGRYRLDGLVPGRTQITFDPTCSGFVSANYLSAQRTVTVRAGRTPSGVDAFLRPAAGISGVVRDFAGKPVDACVSVSDRDADYAFTNANGRYSITGVAPGRYAVGFEDCANSGSLAPQWYDNRPDSGSADLVTFTAGKIDRNINATLHPGGTLAGFLTTTSGRPISGECVAALSQDGSLAESGAAGDNTMSADNGRYVIGDLAPGLYQVAFNCGLGRYASEWFRSQPDATTAEYVAIDPRVTTTVNEKLDRAGIIKGKVTDKAGRPIPDICVNVASARNGQLIPPIDSGAITDHGRYQVGQLAPGRYLVQFTDCDADVYGTQWYRGRNGESFATPVTVRPGRATTGINGVLTAGGTISGRVTGPEGKPAFNTCVFAYDPASMSFEGLAFTGSNGQYTVTGLSSGRYHLSFSNCGSQNLASITLPAAVRVVAPHAVTGVNVKLAAGATITGAVTGSSANPGPLAQACVMAVPANPDGSFPVTTTNASGRYVVSGLAAGTYHVYLADPLCDSGFGLPGLAPQWYRDQPDQPGSNPVTVSAGRTTNLVSATLQPFGGIQGRVTASPGAGVFGECVTAVPFRATADPLSGLVLAPDIAITQSSGHYRLLDLAPGQYKVKFSTGCGATGFATQWWHDATSASSARVITVRYATISGINATLRR
jgi:hypothetical protein